MTSKAIFLPAIAGGRDGNFLQKRSVARDVAISAEAGEELLPEFPEVVEDPLTEARKTCTAPRDWKAGRPDTT